MEDSCGSEVFRHKELNKTSRVDTVSARRNDSAESRERCNKKRERLERRKMGSATQGEKRSACQRTPRGYRDRRITTRLGKQIKFKKGMRIYHLKLSTYSKGTERYGVRRVYQELAQRGFLVNH